jgi:hypothetical protein
MIYGENRLVSEIEEILTYLGPLVVSFLPFLDLVGDGELMLMFCGVGGGV